MHHVTVFLHPRAVSMGLLDGPAVKVDSFDLDEPIPAILDTVFAICNSYPDEMFCAPEHRPIVEQYRNARHRSLSVGDYVLLENGDQHSIYEVASLGFERVADKLGAGFVLIKGQGVSHDPECARLLQNMRRLDRQVIADCLEGE